MTQNSSVKKAARRRMKKTGEKYSEARRAVTAEAQGSAPSEAAGGEAKSLFTAAPRVFGRSLTYSASAYERLDRRAGEAPDRVRTVIDQWWARLPDGAKPQVRERFMDPKLAVHLGAFWELYLHESLRRLCSSVEVDIGNDEASIRRPDLRAVSGRQRFQLEATAVLGDDAVDSKERARADQLYDALNLRLRNRDFLLNIELRKVGAGTPGRGLLSRIDRWLDPLDPDVEISRSAQGAEPPQTIIDFEGWSLDLSATPLRSDLRGRADFGVIGSRVEGSEIFEAGGREIDGWKAIDDVTPLTRSLLAKAAKGYELDDEPFVIAVLCAGPFVEEREIEMALFGQPGQSDGLWVYRGRPRYSRVSAVLTATELAPASCALVEPCVWHNPWANAPLEGSALPYRQIEIGASGEVIEHPAKRRAAEMLGLSPRWPAE